MTDFDLNGLIRETLDQSSEADPRVIAHRLVARIPQDVRDAALASCLGDRVRIEIGRRRMHATVVSAEVAPGTSWRERAADMLKQRVNVAGEWKLLGDCSAEDFDSLADEAERRAAEQSATAAKYRRYALLLRKASCPTLSDLGTSRLGVAA